MIQRLRMLGVEIAAGAVPLVLLVIASIDTGPAPTNAASAQPPTAPPAVPFVASPPTPQQERALAWLASVSMKGSFRSPLDHRQSEPVIDPVKPAVPAPGATPQVDPLGNLRLTGIVGTSDGGMATINGKIYKLGEEVEPGITILEIDARLSTVTVKLNDGSVRKLERKDRPHRGQGSRPALPPMPPRPRP